MLPAPMPRRFTLALSPRELAPPFWVSLSGTLVIWGSAVSISTGVSALRTSMASMLNTVTGSTFSWSSRLKLEPVTVKASSFTVSPALAAGAELFETAWAKAEAKSPATSNPAKAGRSATIRLEVRCMVLDRPVSRHQRQRAA